MSRAVRSWRYDDVWRLANGVDRWLIKEMFSTESQPVSQAVYQSDRQTDTAPQLQTFTSQYSQTVADCTSLSIGATIPFGFG